MVEHMECLWAFWGKLYIGTLFFSLRTPLAYRPNTHAKIHNDARPPRHTGTSVRVSAQESIYTWCAGSSP